MGFTPLDYGIVSVYLAASLGLGLWGKKLIGNIADFLVAGRSLDLFLGVATLAATEIGTVTFMYYAQLGYRTGFSVLLTGLISGAAMLMIGLTGFVVHRFRTLELMTVPEYFQRRYSRNLRVLTGCLVAGGGLLNMGVFLRVEGTFLMILTGIPMRWLVLTMTAILLLEMLYTVLGGMVSIVITDFLQYVLLSLGTIMVTIYCVWHVGWHSMARAVTVDIGAAGWDPLRNAAYGWNYVIFQMLMWLAIFTCWQTTAMRTMSMRSPALAKKVFVWSSLIFFGRGMLPMLWGIAALAMLGPRHDSMTAMPVLLARLLGPGVKGFVVAAMLAATMSSNSSYLLGWSSVISQDVISP
ncbi:MAG: sodium:solute symporter family protein, partial [Terriglobia bacterium]